MPACTAQQQSEVVQRVGMIGLMIDRGAIAMLGRLDITRELRDHAEMERRRRMGWCAPDNLFELRTRVCRLPVPECRFREQHA